MLAMVKGGCRNKNISELRIAFWGVCLMYCNQTLWFIVCICFVCVSTLLGGQAHIRSSEVSSNVFCMVDSCLSCTLAQAVLYTSPGCPVH